MEYEASSGSTMEIQAGREGKCRKNSTNGTELIVANMHQDLIGVSVTVLAVVRR